MEAKITMTKLRQKAYTDAHTALGSLSTNRSNAVEQNMKLKKTPSHTEPFELVASLQGHELGERREGQSCTLDTLKRVSRNATSQIWQGLGRGCRVLVVELHLVVIVENRGA